MKSQLVVITFLLTLVIHAHARIFPSSELKILLADCDEKTDLGMIIRSIYQRPGPSPPPPPPIGSPTEKQSVLGSSTPNPNTDILIIRSPPSPTQVDTINIIDSDAMSLHRYGPTKHQFPRADPRPPPPPPAGSTPPITYYL